MTIRGGPFHPYRIERTNASFAIVPAALGRYMSVVQSQRTRPAKTLPT